MSGSIIFKEKKMTDDFTMITREFPHTITVIPISDVHLGAIEHAKKEWEQFLKFVTETEGVYLTLGGDLINNSTRMSVANPFDETMRPREQKKKMVEYLTPIKDRIICAVSGNHERRSMKDDDVDLTYDIMSKLDLEDVYRENIAFLKLSCGRRLDNSRAASSYTFAITHGAGGGIYTGAAVNRNERFGNIIEGVDCLIVGHTHKGTVSRPSKIVINPIKNVVSVKSYLVISSVSWLNYGGYAAQKMLLPSECSNPQKLILEANSDRKNIEVRW